MAIAFLLSLAFIDDGFNFRGVARDVATGEADWLLVSLLLHQDPMLQQMETPSVSTTKEEVMISAPVNQGHSEKCLLRMSRSCPWEASRLWSSSSSFSVLEEVMVPGPLLQQRWPLVQGLKAEKEESHSLDAWTPTATP